MNEFEKKIRELSLTTFGGFTSEPILKILNDAKKEFPLKKGGIYDLYPTTWSNEQNRENLLKILDWFEKWLGNEDKS